MSDTVTFALIGITVLGIALVGLAAWFYVPTALASHEEHDEHDEHDHAL